MNVFDTEKIRASLLPRKNVTLFSDIAQNDRIISPEVKKRLRDCASRWEGYIHPELDNYNEFFEIRNRCNFEDRYINRRNHLIDLVLCQKFAEGEHLSKIEELVRLICEEKTWCVPAHLGSRPDPKIEHVIELYASETGSVLSVTLLFLGEILAPETAKMIKDSVSRRILYAYTETDSYNWMGTRGQRVNNWNPWINSNIIICALTACEDEERYRELVLRACALTENYINSIPEDGMCDEGVRYWNLSSACLYDMAELVYDITGGGVDLTQNEKIKSASSYIVGMYSEYGMPANFADAGVDFYPDCPLLVRIGQRSDIPLLSDIGAHLYRPEKLRSIHDNFYRQAKNFYTASTIIPKPEIKLPKTTHLSGINVVTFRHNGFFTAFKGGHNNESHNHNDVGSFVLYYKENPVFIDPGVELYSGYTFSGDRYKLWYMRSDFHNVPIISGKTQSPGGRFAATKVICDKEKMCASCDISGAYDDAPSWVRTVYANNGEMVIREDLTNDRENVITLMLKTRPEICENELRFPFGVIAVIENGTDIKIEEFDITGTNPPDGIIGDAANRKTDGYSVLIPKLLTTQWEQNTLFRLTFKPTSDRVSLRVKLSEK